MIYKNNQKVSAIYKGSTPIIKVYKGTQIVWQKGGENYILLTSTPDAEGTIDIKINDVLTPYTSISLPCTNYKVEFDEPIYSLHNFISGIEDLATNESVKYITNLTLNIDSSQVQNMNGMLADCSGLTEIINIENFNVSSTTNISRLFYNNKSLSSLDLSGWNTDNLINLYQTFYACEGLQELNVSNWDTSKTTLMSGLFYRCLVLSNIIGIEDWNVSSLTDASYAFHNTGLTTLNLSNWNPQNLTNVEEMFSYSQELQYINFGENFNVNNFINFDNLFNFCTNLNKIRCTSAFRDWCINNQDAIKLPTSLREGGNGVWDIIDQSFKYKTNATDPDATITIKINGEEVTIPAYTGDEWKTYYVEEEVTHLGDAFREVNGLTHLDLGNINKSQLEAVNNICFGTESLIEIKGVDNLVNSNMTDLSTLFTNTIITELNFSNWETNNVERTYSMLESCGSLSSIIGLNIWNTSHLQNMENMFMQCSSLDEIDISNWDVPLLEETNGTFNGLKYGVVIKLPKNLNPSQLTNYGGMFGGTQPYEIYGNQETIDWIERNFVNLGLDPTHFEDGYGYLRVYE